MARIKTSTPQVVIPRDWRTANPNTYEGPFRMIWCAHHHFVGPWPCDCKPGPHVVALTSNADEIAHGGSRGSAKTSDLLAFMAFKGNPGRSGMPADAAYFNDTHYRGLLMRAQANDLVDLIDRAEAMWAPTGCKITRGNPAIAEWPATGAKVIFGHFGEDGWKKYVGPEYQRIGIDQAEMLPSKELYDRIAGSCRSAWHQLRPQVMLTFNPGGGDELSGAPGQAWLMDYFRIEDYEAGRIDYDQCLIDQYGKTRIFIRSTYKDNPYLYHYVERNEKKEVTVYKPGDGPYVRWLNGIESESLRSAWRDCNWHALSGVYFREFRPNGPLPGDPEHARHVYDPSKVRLEPWFHRWMSIDWGYIHPTDIQFHCKAPWGQTYTEKEITLNRVEPVELGVLIAREARAFLAGLESHHMNIFLSPDAYAKRESENTVATQIAAGINRELGPRAAFVADLTETERLLGAEQALESLQFRRREQRETNLTLLRASSDRVAGWMHMQTMLRFRPLSDVCKPDKDFANRLYLEKGLVAFQDYMNQPEFKAASEILPKWQISSECRPLIKCLPSLMHKPGTNDIAKVDATESKAGDDPADCSRYGLLSEERQGTALAPLDVRIAQRVDNLREQFTGMSPHSIIMAGQMARYNETVGRKKAALPFVGHNRMAGARILRQQELEKRARGVIQ